MFETIGHYKVLDRMGSGGIGVVFRARDTRLGRTVVIKVVGDEIAGDPERRARFVADVRAAQLVSHPGVAEVYEVGEDGAGLFLALEFVPGDTLGRFVAGRPLNAMRAIEHAVQIADALAEAHALGVSHGDLSTATVLITPKGAAKLLDLGLAAWTGGGRRRHDHDDIRSLGAVLFEMTTGTPFVSNGGASPAPSALNRQLPAELDPIVVRMLTADADAAYGSAATVAAELRAVAELLAARTGSAAMPAAVVPLPSAGSGRHWLLVAAVALLIAAIIWAVSRSPF